MPRALSSTSPPSAGELLALEALTHDAVPAMGSTAAPPSIRPARSTRLRGRSSGIAHEPCELQAKRLVGLAPEGASADGLILPAVGRRDVRPCAGHASA
jgi:hypothetical protein